MPDDPLPASLAVWPADPACAARAALLAGQLAVPCLPVALTPARRQAFAFLLAVTADGLVLWQGNSRIAVDFVSGANQYRRLHGGGRGQPVAKAVGLKAGNIIPSVFDCTAGLARDAFVLAALGCPVHLCERSPLVHALLQDGLQRAGAVADAALREIVLRMTLVPGDAMAHLASLDEAAKPDVIYLDPMFPERRKRAAVKKDMAAFHALVGADEDAAALLPLALQQARCRVVVKRPRHAPYLADEKPGLVLEGESTRFDIYPLRSMAASAA